MNSSAAGGLNETGGLDRFHRLDKLNDTDIGEDYR
jgi:hypothetical protein